ncbi:AAA family ATPase [Thiomicrorhabdus chilensis]|uniref:AAA family ATPase n=1 Tax=Thiomicrorhabdus chilensis TaxID=63656 RepID=UPI00146FAC0A|nr:ATP-binding protein [Thiomicrorhabdus chilensis]
MKQNQKRDYAGHGALSFFFFIPAAGILYIWPEAIISPYILLFFAALTALAFSPFPVNWWRILLFTITKTGILWASLYFSSGIVTPEKNPMTWIFGAFLFNIGLSLLFVKIIEISVEGYTVYPKQETYSQKQPIPAGNGQPSQEGELLPANEFPARLPRFTFKDVHGMENMKGELSKTVNFFKEEGGNGILLFGAPGNGKTFVAESLAGELGVKILEARTQELTSKWIGDTTEKIKRIFEAAQAQAPCVLFLDEIDSFLQDRGDSGMNQDQNQSANTLLTAIAELNRGYKEHGILIVAATNFIDKLDGAGIREGRFDKKIEVYSPDFEARKFILLDGVLGYPVDEKMVEQVVARWEGFSVSRMRAIAKIAKRFAREENRTIDIDLLSRALREVQGRLGDQLSENTIGLNDLSFNKFQKEALDVILEIMRDRHRIEASGGKVPKGMLMFGAPGTGKTTVAKALAKELGWAFISTSGQELLSSPSQIDVVIKKAADLRPAVIFIDEAEGVLADRQLNPHTKEITNKLLVAIDGEKPLHDIFIVAATNHPDDIDPAMVRYGRLSQHMDLTPDAGTIKSIVQNFMNECAEHVQFIGDVDALSERLIERRYYNADTIGCLSDSVTYATVKQGNNTEKVTVDLNRLP